MKGKGKYDVVKTKGGKDGKSFEFGNKGRDDHQYAGGPGAIATDLTGTGGAIRSSMEIYRGQEHGKMGGKKGQGKGFGQGSKGDDIGGGGRLSGPDGNYYGDPAQAWRDYFAWFDRDTNENLTLHAELNGGMFD